MMAAQTGLGVMLGKLTKYLKQVPENAADILNFSLQHHSLQIANSLITIDRYGLTFTVKLVPRTGLEKLP